MTTGQLSVSELEEARAALAADWNQRSPTTQEEIADFYRTTEHYGADLDAWHSDVGRQMWSTIIVEAARASGSKRILDIGAGAGHDIDALWADNYEYVIDCVEPNLALQERLKHRSRARYIYNTLEDIPADEEYDLIYCIDVLEHVPDPDAQILEPMLKHLKAEKGTFIEATATHDTGTPLHLTSLRGWSPARFLDRHGFLIREEIGDGRLRIWQRYTEKRDDSPTLLICAYRTLTIPTAGAMMRLVNSGWRKSIHSNDALISRVRSVAVSKWLQDDDGDVFLMVDDDIVFAEEDAQKVIKLAREKRGIASAAYPVRGGTHLASRLLDNEVTFGPELPAIEIKWAATGFFAVHRDVCEAIAATQKICILNEQIWFWPMFMPFVYENEERGYNEYLSEDWAFCERAKQLGFKVWLDRTVQLAHIGQVPFTIAKMSTSQVFDQLPSDGGF